MRIEHLIEVCQAYSDLGWAVQAQLKDYALDGEALEAQNPNALKMILDFLESYAGDVTDQDMYVEEIREYLENLKEVSA